MVGFALDDTNVALLVSNPRFEREKVRDVVTTTQIAPRTLKALSLKPSALKAVCLEKTHVLPALELNDDSP